MNLEEIYEYIILFVVSLFTYNIYNKYRYATYNGMTAVYHSGDNADLLLCLILIFAIGLRPMSNGGWADSANIQLYYKMAEGNPFEFTFDTNNFIWDNLFNLFASARLGITRLFLICSTIYFGCTYAACKKWFPNDHQLAYIVFLGAFSTYSYSYNGFKAGAAGALFLVSIAYYEKKWFSILFLILSLGFHHSMQMPIAAYILTLFYKNTKWYFYGWFFCVAMAVLHVSFFQGLFASLSDQQAQGYLALNQAKDDFGGAGGFRIDFLLYSAAPIWVGYNVIMKGKEQVSSMYSILLNMYLFTNGIWCLCMYANYTNRIAYLSWFLYPIVLIYPFLKENLEGCAFLKGRDQYDMLSKIVGYHLCFTLFMELIFYKFIKN